MKTLFYTACLLMVLSGYSQWQAFALQVVELARQQLPQPIAEFFPTATGGAFRKEETPGLEGKLTARLEDALRELSESGRLNDARVTLKQVRYVTSATVAKLSPEKAMNRMRRTEATPKEVEGPGHYVATITYDLISPLSVESGIDLVTTAHSLGIAEVRLSDGYGMVKTFQMPQLRN
jgi:hypothetical protein